MSVPIVGRRFAVPEPLAPGELAIEASSVGVVIDGKRILHDVTLDARAGEVHALIGPNGAGKSTLLATITGDQTVTEGRITVAGRPLQAWSARELSRRRAVLLQHNDVFFPFTVQQVVEMGRAPWQRTELERDDDEAVAAAIAETDIARLSGRQVPSLSGGERARAALARVLAQRTGILLLDEPTAALDLRHQEDVLRLARDAAAAGDAVIVVLHDLNLAAAYADRISLLEQGRLVTTGSPAEVLTAERITEVYRYPVEVVTHPTSGALVILPIR
ncbi:heme ABC transporter ATP-binding protein [Plantibacter sp. MCCC 1A11337]|uniref:heme ABC transporter ATP-binding protein n=1 Tax=Plantibacter sp. MCCC 1A11337 TaxID=2736644 RepID=UPI0015836E7B|nr:heme ABC transporter ATP-binding protein [Plantibacter sp. MCCC 1A11337]NUJ90119.1 heme ABC transporter ATP-binding protein [Plantibacter sp. MCCC 1A11337]